MSFGKITEFDIATGLIAQSTEFSPASTLLVLLLAGHFLADFAFQTKSMVQQKRSGGWSLLHGAEVVVVHGVLIIPFISLGGAAVILTIGLAHLLIDRFKTQVQRTRIGCNGAFALDQALHVTSLLVFVQLWIRFPDWQGPLFTAFEPHLNLFTQIAILAAAYAFTWTGGAMIVAAVLRKHNLNGDENVRERTDNQEQQTGDEGPSRGRTIGILERLLALTLVLVGQWGALAVVLAAKSIARFKELEDKRFSERYLIGTLTSVLIAVALGLVSGFLLRATELQLP